MLPAGQHVRQVYARRHRAERRARIALLIDCSTIDVDSALRRGARRARPPDFRFADAPVSGGIMAADAGTLAFMVGCADGDLRGG